MLLESHFDPFLIKILDSPSYFSPFLGFQRLLLTRASLSMRLSRLCQMSLRPSKRIRATDEPCIVAMQRMLRGKQGILSLAQGIVHWAPPPGALAAARQAADEPESNAYGADDGLVELRMALKEKLRKENELTGVEVMVTAGANQGYTNLVCALLDEQVA